ncbi:MAG TPA: AMP-binding protein, partial [Polyangiaceae bacterium]|nr:AMP-binding protein [Polyangiaceae bacterium]
MTSIEVHEGDLLWSPTVERVERARIRAYMAWLESTGVAVCHDFAALHAFSVERPGAFWRSIADYFEVRFRSRAQRELDGAMPNARWFEGATLNYAEHAFARRDGQVALVFRSESGERASLTYAELAERVARARAGMRRLGVGRGDRVAALLPNRIEAVVAFLAA